MKLEILMETLKNLDGVSKRQAQKIALSFLKNKKENIEDLNKILNLLNELSICSVCGVIKEKEECINHNKQSEIIVIFKTLEEYLTFSSEQLPLGIVFIANLEKTKDFTNLEKINESLNRLEILVKQAKTKEIIFMMSPSIETEIFIRSSKQHISAIKNDMLFSKLLVGVPFGGKIEYFDKNTMKEAVEKREKV